MKYIISIIYIVVYLKYFFAVTIFTQIKCYNEFENKYKTYLVLIFAAHMV